MNSKKYKKTRKYKNVQIQKFKIPGLIDVIT